MEEDGKAVSSDKYIWSQARWLWTCSALYNRIEKRPEFLTWARATIDFLLKHGRDEQGRWVYHTTRVGQIIEGATSIYSDCFVVYGLSEYCRADPDATLLALAMKMFADIQERIAAPEFAETAPYKLPPNRRNHGVPMILTEVAGELARTTSDARLSCPATPLNPCGFKCTARLRATTAKRFGTQLKSYAGIWKKAGTRNTVEFFWALTPKGIRLYCQIPKQKFGGRIPRRFTPCC
jgi:hypothetical protein